MAINTNQIDPRIQQWDSEHFIHPWEDLSDLGKKRRTIVSSAEDIYVFDEQGKRLLDAPAGMWCVQLGYRNEEIAEAAKQQILNMGYSSPWGVTNEPATLLAKKLSELTPGDLNHVMFSTGGSTAVDSAIRFVGFYNNYLKRSEKKHIIAREKAYHGSSYISASCSGKERDVSYFNTETNWIHHISAPETSKRPKHMSEEQYLQSLIKEFEDKILEIGAHKVAAFIAEPVMGAGGVIVAPKNYYKKFLEICRKYDIIFISDEVVTGFGRLGYWFASEDVFGIKPDIITCAKGITSGYQPLGATFISKRLMDEISKNNDHPIFSNGYTYSGHAVSCAVSLKTIEIIERENILQHVREISDYFQQKIRTLQDIPIVRDVRGIGLMAAVECELNEGDDDLELDENLGQIIDQNCQKLGLLVRPIINNCVMSPPLTINKKQTDEIVDILRKSIIDAMRHFTALGKIKNPA